MTEGRPPSGGKRDRLARFYRVVRYLEAHPEGVAIGQIAEFVGMSPRTVYRDVVALEGELGIPIWSEDGRWGVEGSAFLPPLKLTQSEAMAVVIAARLLARYADHHDPDLAAAFQKLADVLPEPLRVHVERTLDEMARRPRSEPFLATVRALTRAWIDGRVVSLSYASSTGPADSPRTARVRPYLIEPSTTTHALYLIGFDETVGAVRTFKIDRIRSITLAPERFAPEEGREAARALDRAWGIIADQDAVGVVLRFRSNVAGRVRETTWHPTQSFEVEPDGSLVWRATVPGTVEIRLWILEWGPDVEVLAPAELRADVAQTHRAAAAVYGAW